MEITVRPRKGSSPIDEQGVPIADEITVEFNEFWAHRIVDKELEIVKAKGKRT